MEETALEVLNLAQPVTDVVQPLFVKLSVLVGGVFGIYVLLLLVRIYFEHQKVKLLKSMKYDLDILVKAHKAEPYSERPSAIRKLLRKINGTPTTKKRLK